MSRIVKPFSLPPEAEAESFLWSGADLPDDRIRALAVGAWFAMNWEAYHDSLDLSTSNQSRREEAIVGLHDSWDVTDEDSALSTILRLHRGMHAPFYEMVHPLVMQRLQDRYSPDPTQGRNELRGRHHAFLSDAAGVRGWDSRAFIDSYEAWLQAIKLGACESIMGPFPADIHAWDLTRAVFVARAGCTAGYLTPEQVWPILHSGLQLAQARYATWRQFGQSYLAGALFWYAEIDLAETRGFGFSRLANLGQLWQHPLSPWRRLELHPDVPSLTLTPAHSLTQEVG